MKAIPLVLLMQLLLSIVSCYLPENKTTKITQNLLMFSNKNIIRKKKSFFLKCLLHVFVFLTMATFVPIFLQDVPVLASPTFSPQ